MMQEASCANVLKVLADETRMAVVEMLMDRPRHVGEMLDELSVEQSLLSHHLRILRDAGFVVAHRDGKAVLYRLARREPAAARQDD
jgi:ArsR family transcriptional regulator